MNLSFKKDISFLEISGIFYTFAITFSSSTGSILVKGARLLIFFALVATFVKSPKIRIPKKQNEYVYWSASFFVVCAASYFWAVSKSIVLSSLLSLLYILIANWILLYILYKNQEYIFSIMKTVVWVAILHGLNIYLRYGFNIYFLSRGGDTVDNANTLAYIASFGVIFSIILISNAKTTRKNLYTIACCINALFALLTASKKVFIFIGIFAIIYYIFQSKNPLKILRNIGIACVCVLVISFVVVHVNFLYNLVGDRIITMISGFNGEKTDSSTGFRIQLIIWGLEWFREKPIIGHGIDCYKYLLGTNYDTWAGSTGVYAHNNYIELLVDLGIVGVATYYSLYIAIIVHGWKLRQENNIIYLASVAIIVTFLVTEFGQMAYSVAFLQEIILIAWFIVYRYEENIIEADYEQ